MYDAGPTSATGRMAKAAETGFWEGRVAIEDLSCGVLFCQLIVDRLVGL
ncbi:hypothetical protein POX_d05048 [Penicillium oxalicum]|nr:hypothetical protein POX_d05048 [Penicillium oxalicum]KAI2789555.1 hypothetical protein POX_d05048 [Penicillium oxalicum]